MGILLIIGTICLLYVLGCAIYICRVLENKLDTLEEKFEQLEKYTGHAIDISLDKIMEESEE